MYTHLFASLSEPANYMFVREAGGLCLPPDDYEVNRRTEYSTFLLPPLSVDLIDMFFLTLGEIREITIFEASTGTFQFVSDNSRERQNICVSGFGKVQIASRRIFHPLLQRHIYFSHSFENT